MSGASRTLMPCRCACSTTSSTVRSSKSASERITSSGLISSSTLGELRAMPEEPEARNRLGCDDSDELVGQAASGRLERRAEPDEALAVADEHTRRLIPAARMSSSETDSYDARRSPIVSADTTTDVGIRPEVVKS